MEHDIGIQEYKKTELIMTLSYVFAVFILFFNFWVHQHFNICHKTLWGFKYFSWILFTFVADKEDTVSKMFFFLPLNNECMCNSVIYQGHKTCGQFTICSACKMFVFGMIIETPSSNTSSYRPYKNLVNQNGQVK